MPEDDADALCADLALQERLLRRALAADGLAALVQRLSADLAALLPHEALWLTSRPDSGGATRCLAAWPPEAGSPAGRVELHPNWRAALPPSAVSAFLAGPADPVYEPALCGAGFAAHLSLPVTLSDGTGAVLTLASTSADLARQPGARVPWLAPCLTACLAGACPAPPTVHRDPFDPTELADYLCAAVAHDIRNIMSGIIGAVELHRAEMNETQGAVFDAVRRRALDGVAMAESMRDYLRRSRPDARPSTDLPPLLARVHGLLAPVLGATLGSACPRLVVELEPALTLADPGEIQRAVTSLVYNAARHCGPGNTIILRSRADARHAFVEVEDDGPGLSAEVLRQAKAPFYTTLPALLDGLGLAIADGVARVSDGSLSIRPGARGGARVIMALALATPPHP